MHTENGGTIYTPLVRLCNYWIGLNVSFIHQSDLSLRSRDWGLVYRVGDVPWWSP